jgi:hypothetical protein
MREGTENFVFVFLVALKYKRERKRRRNGEIRSERHNLLLIFYSSGGYRVVPARPSSKGRLEAK